MEKKQDTTKCPVCGEPAKMRCKCPRVDSTCANGHKWHFCMFHKKVVLGESDHSKPTFDCSCPPGEQETEQAVEKFTEEDFERIRNYSDKTVVGPVRFEVLAESIKLYMENSADMRPVRMVRIYSEACTKDRMLLMEALAKESDICQLAIDYVEWRAACIIDGEYAKPPEALREAAKRVLSHYPFAKPE